MSLARRRCKHCQKPIVMEGPKQSGLYFTRAVPGGFGVATDPLCWGCYRVSEGNPRETGGSFPAAAGAGPLKSGGSEGEIGPESPVLNKTGGSDVEGG